MLLSCQRLPFCFALRGVLDIYNICVLVKNYKDVQSYIYPETSFFKKKKKDIVPIGILHNFFLLGSYLPN